MPSRSLLWPMVLAASSVCVALLVLGHVNGPVRVVMVGGFLLVCPGMASVRRFRVADQGTELVLAIAISIGLETLLAAGMLYAGWWSPTGLLVLLLGFCFIMGVDELVMTYYLRASGRRTAGQFGIGGER
jgi:hypothetical protein